MLEILPLDFYCHMQVHDAIRQIPGNNHLEHTKSQVSMTFFLRVSIMTTKV